MTTAELVKALRACSHGPEDNGGCSICPLEGSEDCIADAMTRAADLIEQLTAENVVLPNGETSAIETLLKELEWKDMVIALAQKEQSKAEAERDALLERIKARRSCLDCKHYDFCEFDDANVIDCMNCTKKNCPCAQCCNSSRWEWRGLPELEEGVR